MKNNNSNNIQLGSPKFCFTMRLSVLAPFVVLLSACASLNPPASGMAQNELSITGVAAAPTHIDGYGTLRILRTSAARLQVSVPEQSLSFLLDPEVVEARAATPIVRDHYTVLPLHIRTAACAHRMVVYVIRNGQVDRFDYLGTDCGRPIADESTANRWQMGQRTANGARQVWRFDGERLTHSVVQPRRAARPVSAGSSAPAATSRPTLPRTPAAAPAPGEPLFIDLL